MKLLPELSFYINSFSNNILSNRELLNILFNKKNEFILNKNILTYIEQNIDANNLEYYQAFVKEIADDTRYTSVDTLTIDNYKNDALNYYSNCVDSFLIPIKISQNSEFNNLDFNNLLDLTNISDNNYNFILKSLISNNLINYNFSNFNLNSEIDELFENLYKIPKTIKYVYCFNRDYSSKFLEKLANKRIFYYSLVKREFPRNIHEYKEYKKEMRNVLGGALDIYITKRTSLIHERKIFINGLSITFDNAFENIICEEPTWEITIEYCESKFTKWIEKIGQFQILN